MSSYVINKENFMRAAGAIAGLQAAKGRYDSRSYLYMWNYEEGRLCNDDDFIKMFDDLYSINFRSVMWQYGEPLGEYDSNLYHDEFLTYKNFMRNSIWYREIHHNFTIDQFLMVWGRFVSSVMYQIENPEGKEQAHKILDRISNSLLRAYGNYCESDEVLKDLDLWGAFELPTV